MKNLTNVTEIYLNDNKLTVLPDLIKHMTKLKVLTFASNEIKEVPDWIGEVKNLQRLNVSQSTKKIPDSILKLKKLRRKTVENNEADYAKNFPKL